MDSLNFRSDMWYFLNLKQHVGEIFITRAFIEELHNCVVLSLPGFWSRLEWIWVDAGRHVCLSRPKGSSSAPQMWLRSFTAPACVCARSHKLHRAFDAIPLLGLFNDLLKLVRCLFIWQSWRWDYHSIRSWGSINPRNDQFSISPSVQEEQMTNKAFHWCK